ncbi:MAG TPA: helix-hairpin-helix domain-containing protein [Ignavibacteria bacterium]|nr:helix-hairpin-helix domain-containing protein [Ignavibacteria bacterium]
MKDWQKYIGFTKNEKRVILFLIIVLTVGFSIKLYVEVISKPELPPYDFSEFDEKYRKASETYSKLLSGDTTISDSLNNVIDSLLNKKQNEYKEFLSVNINTATINDFIKLPGIGEAMAGEIVAYRNKKGNFRKIEDIMKVDGIKKAKFDKIKEFIKIKD